MIHAENKGYGANQKTCYATALCLGADIVIMLHLPIGAVGLAPRSLSLNTAQGTRLLRLCLRPGTGCCPS